MDNLSSLPRLGPKTLEKLTRLKINTPTDLLYHFPHRYIDFSRVESISSLEVNTQATITGQLLNFRNIYTRSHKSIQTATIKDDTGKINLIWFNQPYLSKNFIIGQNYSFAGTVSLYQNKPTIIGAITGQYNTGKIIPVYPETTGLSSSWFRQIFSIHLDKLLSNIVDPLPPQDNLMSLKTALQQIHQPSSLSELEKATTRLGLDEMLSLQAQSYLSKKTWSQKTPKKIFTDRPEINKFIDSLPFSLTKTQLNAWQEIKADLLASRPCNRLLQGDVGSGKTVLAVLACLLAHLNNSTSLVIAPTEILAQQHLATFKKLLKLPIKFLTSNNKMVKCPSGSIIIATHAAIYQKESFAASVGLLIVDEQHKFGVSQRTFLIDSLQPPHYLTMTATPIPRTVSLTIMGNLDISVLDSLPSHRLPIKSYMVPPPKISECYHWLDQHIITTKQQAFVVCPFIEPSETLTSVKSATILYDELKSKIFPHQKVALIHGKTKLEDRNKILDDFKKNKVSILVTTPIIEVGIDFPNATVMIIQSADRFGLAQLHQLRGRVGRGADQSFCYLFSESTNQTAIDRLKMLSSTTDGQKIAEYDLKTRGPGEIFSLIQHGFPSLKIANLSDYKLISLGQKIITKLVSEDFDLTRLIHHHSVISATN